MKTLMTTAAASAIALVSAAPELHAVELTLATDLSPTHTVSVEGIDVLMNCVTSAAGDEVKFNYFPSGQIAKRNEGISALNNGIADISYTSVGLETAKIPLQGVTMLPGLSKSAEQSVAAWRATLDADGILAQEWKKNGIRPLLINALAPYQIMADVPYMTVEDWQGKKVRAPGSALNFLVNSMGGSPVEMSAADLYVAMQRGTVDSTILSMASVKPYSLQEVIKAMSNNTSLGTATQFLAMSEKTWSSLTPELQEIFDQCGRSTEILLARLLDESESGLMDEFTELGIEIYSVPDEELAKIEEKISGVADDFVKRLSDRGLPAQEALDEYKQALSSGS